MLFEPDRHEALCTTAWDAVQAQQAIQTIARDAELARLPQGHWPVHPLDLDGGDPVPPTGYHSIYLGSAGVIWALWYLQCVGAVDSKLDAQSAIARASDCYRCAPDTSEVVPSYFLGDVGIELVHWRLTGSREALDRMYAQIRQNIPNPTNEALWAAPGTMVAAWHLWEQTGEDRWRTLFADNIEQLWNTWLPLPDRDCYMWTQDLYGNTVQLLGAGHGYVGNVYPLLRGAALLDADRRAALYARCTQTLALTALWEGERANWPQGIGTPRPGRTKKLMQWCHGAPGVVTALAADFPQGVSVDMDTMLLAAGEAVWAAGPLAKGSGLCHGTAGNGYAFLKLFQRTGDALWRDRARAFAMHAIAQREVMHAHHGMGRYNLWTGDLGLAVYLWHCTTGGCGLPALDIID